ncbi:DUF692 domain-containing protein [Streptomyces sp. P3]|uniref:DUF692 domain-containing protein n=1 Tax=Streptomyces sp. P3 TaxID=2135430 RepID=UPI000D1AC345|nr:DUF692 domain-containing protein [Streptomyces sp. P3]AVV44922.1 DUF692 domain-containing protein [Streptomyces sp. P3]
MVRLGTGIGWRPEIADAVERMQGIDWVEAVAENLCPGHLPDSLLRLRERGVTVIPHGVSLGLGDAERPDAGRLTALAERAEALGSPLVTEHIAFVRAGGPLTASARLEAGHLLPVPRTRDALDVLCENVRIAQEQLPVPLAVENIAALVAWPGEEMTEGQFLYELADRTGVRLLVDVANLHTNHVNRGEDPVEALSGLPLEALAYVHVAGGFERDGVWHDSHAHPVPRPVLDVLTELASRVSPPGVLLERDDNFPQPAELERELGVIREAVELGSARRGATVTTDADVLPAATRIPVPARTAAGAAEGAGTATACAEIAVAAGAATGAGAAIMTTTAYAKVAVTAGAATACADIAVAAGAATAWADIAVAAGAATACEDVAVADGAAAGVVARRPERTPPGEAIRQRLGLAQTALLSALVAGTPVPEGFDRVRLGVQARALAAKRADVVAKVAPELPQILGSGYRAAFVAYAAGHPMHAGYRQDALDFAAQLLGEGRPVEGRARRELRRWWLDRSGPVPRRSSRLGLGLGLGLGQVGRSLIRR